MYYITNDYFCLLISYLRIIYTSFQQIHFLLRLYSIVLFIVYFVLAIMPRHYKNNKENKSWLKRDERR